MVEYFAYFMLLWQKINMNFLNWKTNLSRRHPHQNILREHDGEIDNSAESKSLSERPNLHFVGSAEPMPNHDLSGRTDAEP